MKKITIHLIVLLSLYSTAFAQVNLQEQLLLHYIFSGNALDQSGNGVNATANGNPVFTTDRFGSANSAYQFDGTDDYLDMNAATLTTTQFSYSLWAYPASNDNISCVLSVGSDDENQAILLSFQDGWIAGSFLKNGDAYTANTPAVPELNKWYHIVMTRNNNLVQLYINGDSISSMDISNVEADYGISPLANIGRRCNTASQYFTGKIDDVRIYGRVINKAEVKALFQETETGPTALTGEKSLNFILSPNPSKDNVRIELPKTGTYEIALYNSLGKLLENRTYENTALITDLSLENKETGVYFILIKSSEGTGTGKIIHSY